MALKLSTILAGPLAAIIASSLWGLSVSFKWPLIRARTFTIEMINDTERLVQKYVRDFGDTPPSLVELRLFSIEENAPYSAYDAWGERLEYLRLGRINYLIRSFGADGVQNRPNRNLDIGVYHWGNLPQIGLRYDEDSGSMHPRPSVVLFAGSDNSSSTWHAKLFVDPVTGSRRLLVRSRLKDNFYMLAPHDAVEEFLWVPGQDKIVFTASQSGRYSDGLYIWDLRNDQTANLFSLDSDGESLDPGTKQRRFFVAMSAVRNTNPPSVSVFAMPADQFLLNPNKFFSSENIHVFSLGSEVVHTRPSAAQTGKGSLFDLGFLGTETVAKGGEGSPLQQAWLRLPLEGDWEKGVIAWQHFAAQHGRTQLAPYAVWGLAMFYQEAAKRAGGTSKAGEIFTSYSIELGSNLSRMLVAPGYVRGIGAWIAGQS